jgi:glycine cleavage system H protein
MLDPKTLRYAESHEWAAIVDGQCIVGVTQHAIELLNEVTYLKLPKPGMKVSPKQDIGEIESVKSVNNLYAPVAGTVIAANEEAVNNPTLVNADPYGAGWLVKIAPDADATLSHLMDAAGYETHCQNESH